MILKTNLFAVKSNTLNRLFHPHGIIRRESKQHTALQNCLLRVFDLTANKFVYALIAKSLGTLQAADTSQAFVILKTKFVISIDQIEQQNQSANYIVNSLYKNTICNIYQSSTQN